MEAEYAEVFPNDGSLSECGCYVRNPYALGIKRNVALVPLKHIDYQL